MAAAKRRWWQVPQLWHHRGWLRCARETSTAAWCKCRLMHLARICPWGISRLFGHVQGTPALCAGCNMLSHGRSGFTPSACADWCLLPVCLRLVIAFCPCCILPSAFCLLPVQSCPLRPAFCSQSLPSAYTAFCLSPCGQSLPSAWAVRQGYGKLMSLGKASQQVHQASTYAVLLQGLVSNSIKINNCLATEVIQHSVCEPHTTMQASVRVCVCTHVCPSLAASTQAATRHWQQHDSCISRSAKLSEAAVPSTVTTRLPLPLVSFQKPLLQVLACIFEVRLLSACP